MEDAKSSIVQIGFICFFRVILWTQSLMKTALAKRVKCTILYASETGRSEHFASTLFDICKRRLNVKVVTIDVALKLYYIFLFMLKIIFTFITYLFVMIVNEIVYHNMYNT